MMIPIQPQTVACIGSPQAHCQQSSAMKPVMAPTQAGMPTGMAEQLTTIPVTIAQQAI
ncbi:MAG TPA: hypothetical protein VN844_23050 [Pyrinomonadaceae bacterium]|nr:hypothetical protein [Pyrinomonadaceae bacterium]